MNKLKAIELFVRVVEKGSFSQVAEELQHSQPQVSKAVASLESALGLALLQRTTRKMQLTCAGEKYYQHCREMLNALEATEESLDQQQNTLAGTLRITIPVAYGERVLMPLLWQFMHQHPAIHLEVSFSDRYIDLLEDGIAMAVRIGHLKDSSLKARKLGESTRYLVASPAYLLEHPALKTPEDLKNHDCVLYGLQQQSPGFWNLHNAQNKHWKVKVSGRVRCDNAEGVIDACLHDLGIALAPHWLADRDLQQGRLCRVLTGYEGLTMPIHAIYPPGKHLPQRVKALSDYLKKHLS
jgi:DNA-binding transcriptional LysR family regulator